MNTPNTVLAKVTSGILGGLAGGVAFGFIMKWQGILPFVARLVGSDSEFIGYLVHLGIAAIIGLIFGLFYGPAQTLGVALRSGTLYGIIWWILGPQLLVPLWLGFPLPATPAAWIQNAFSTSMVWSLIGHILYGIISAVLGQVLQGVVGGLFLGLKERARA